MNLIELEEKARAATPGPWVNFYEGGGDHIVQQVSLDETEVAVLHSSCSLSNSESFETASANASFIAAANPATVLALIEVAMAAKAFDEALDGAAGNLETIAAGDVMSEALAKLEAL